MAYNEVFFGKGHRFDRVMLLSTIDMMTRFELFMPRAYKDAKKGKDVWCIGFGHQAGGNNEPKVITEDMTITLEEAKKVFALDLQDKVRFVDRLLGDLKVNTYMFNGMVSVCFNMGEGSFRKTRIVPLIREGKYVSACAAFNDYVKKWSDKKDENGNPIFKLNPDGTTLLDDHGEPVHDEELVVDNGLVVRRQHEGAIFSTFVA